MKKWIGVIVCALYILSGCNKMNTDLEGKWQLNRIESNGDVSVVDTVWYNFQTSLFQYQIYKPGEDVYIHQLGFNYYDDDKLSLELISDPRPVKNFLIYTDWTETKRDFIVEKVGNKELILECQGKRYYFKKF